MKPEIGKRYRFWLAPGGTRNGVVLAMHDGMVRVHFDNGEVDWELEEAICGAA